MWGRMEGVPYGSGGLATGAQFGKLAHKGSQTYLIFGPKLKQGPMEKRVVQRPSFSRSLNRWS